MGVTPKLPLSDKNRKSKRRNQKKKNSGFAIKPTIIVNLIAYFIKKKRTKKLQIIDYFGAIMLKRRV
jgi:hypothetical protein